ncbi:MAG: type II toxin-antitoxin system RelE/ParE family toxin [Chitinophagales bacterium]
MKKEVVILPKAEISLQSILDYLLAEWSIQVHNDFLQEIEKIAEQISLFPKSFPIFHQQNIRRAIINKHIVLFFVEKNEVIEILLFWNMKQHPKKLKL